MPAPSQCTLQVLKLGLLQTLPVTSVQASSTPASGRGPSSMSHLQSCRGMSLQSHRRKRYLKSRRCYVFGFGQLSRLQSTSPCVIEAGTSTTLAPFTDCVVNHFLVQTVPFLLDMLAQLFHVRDPMVVVHTLL